MAQSPVTVTYSLEEILGDIKQSIKETNQKLDTLQKDVTDIKAGQVKLETELAAVKEDIKEIKGTQKNQIWILITLLGGSLIAVALRSFFKEII